MKTKIYFSVVYKFVFLCSVISQRKAVAIDRLITDYAKSYCNRTLIVHVILENAVTCFFSGTRCILNAFH